MTKNPKYVKKKSSRKVRKAEFEFEFRKTGKAGRDRGNVAKSQRLTLALFAYWWLSRASCTRHGMGLSLGWAVRLGVREDPQL